jgi:DNA-binding XRE family transcriptional regulator
MDVRRKVAARRQAARKELGLRPEQLAAKLDISRETLLDWEAGAYWPMSKVSERWRNALRPGSRSGRQARRG